MNLTDKINNDLKEAIKAKDKDALRALRAIKSAILLAKTDGSGQELTDEVGMKLLQKLVKQRQDSLEIYEKQGREDLAVTERQEIEIISKYLPEAMSREELETTLKSLVEELGASSMKDMGRVMGTATKQLAGKADGKDISTIVRQLLS
ncbi:MAG: GatB/YqeY domain-containing protein [Bacteroidota bacterium]